MKTLNERVAGMKLGDTLLVEPADVDRARMAGCYRGHKMHIVHRNVGGLVLMQRVAETKWGQTKARAAAMEIGDSITVPAAQYASLCACALRMQIYLSRTMEADGLVTLTRVAVSVKKRSAPVLRALKIGARLPVPNHNRALSLCTSAPRYGVRLSRKQSPTGEYILTRVA